MQGSTLSTATQIHKHGNNAPESIQLRPRKARSGNMYENMTASSNDARDTGLIGIALIIRSREGPRFVFHYPAHPTPLQSAKTVTWGTDLDEQKVVASTDSDSDDGEDDLEDSGKRIYIDPESDEHVITPKGAHMVPWEHLLGFPTKDLESILTPAKSYHKKRFELTLDPLYFISYPIHIREDGLWKKKKPKKPKRSKKSDTAADTPDGGSKETLESDAKEPNGDDKPESPDDNKSEDGDDLGGMTMFNIFFILKLSKQDAPERASEMYEHVIKKLNKALHLSQHTSNYVWKESEMILTMKEKAREEKRPMSWLWSHILLKSTLAAAMRDVFYSIQNNRIATISLAASPTLDMSLQIPIPAFLMSLPAYDEVGMPGLTVTSANYLLDDEGNEDCTYINKHFALLLLDQESKVIAELEADRPELSQPLIQCIQVCKPTSSFLQVSRENSLELGDLLTLARHLIDWRRAIAIPPLHNRNRYIVSPNCDIRRLPAASVVWKKAFSLSPPLQSFLSALSRAPREYKSFAPSKNHRPTYLEMLAWLLRGGWVVQVFHFSWIIVWPEIIYEVQYQLRAEAIENAKTSTPDQNGSTRDESPDDGATEPIPSSAEVLALSAHASRLASKNADRARTQAQEFTSLPVPLATSSPSTNYAPHLQHIAPYIIKDPHRTSHEESLYIAAIGKRIAKDGKEGDAERWARCVKYFNGREALEGIAAKEGVKRKEAGGWLAAYQGWLITVQRW